MLKAKKDYKPPTHAVVHPANPNMRSGMWLQDDGRISTSLSVRWSTGKVSGFKVRNFTLSEVRELIELLILTLLKLEQPISPHLQAYLDELSKTRAST